MFQYSRKNEFLHRSSKKELILEYSWINPQNPKEKGRGRRMIDACISDLYFHFAVGTSRILRRDRFRPVCGIRVNRLPVNRIGIAISSIFFFFFFNAVRKHKRIPFRSALPIPKPRRPWLHRGSTICERRGNDGEENARSTSFDTRDERDVFNSRDDPQDSSRFPLRCVFSRSFCILGIVSFEFSVSHAEDKLFFSLLPFVEESIHYLHS